MRQAVRELLTNAVKFSAPGTPIGIAVHPARDEVRVAVTSRGPTIPLAERVRLFDRFYRTPYATANAIQGFGIGLTLVHDAITAHGGAVRADSADGVTTFEVTIPCG